MPDLSREEELGLWRIVPAFLRKRSKTPVAQEEPGTEEPAEVPPAPPAGRAPAEGRSKLELRQRLSWTYGGNRANRRVETEPVAAERQEVARSTSVVERRELQRGSSFPGRLGAAGGISKEEAKRRLVSWRRTTIVRKTSEQTV